MQSRSTHRRRTGAFGFTLIELLVVITILGVLAAVVVFSVRGVTDKGQATAQKTDAQVLRTAEEAYFAKNGRYASDIATLVAAGLVASGSANLDSVNTEGVDPTKPGGFNVVCGDSTKASIPPGCGGTGVLARGGTLTVAETFLLSSQINPAATTGGGVHAWWETLYNGLIELDGSGNPVPSLATVVPTVANGGITNSGATYTLHLRTDVVWHDSTSASPKPFTSADVKFTFEKVLLRLHARTRSMAAFLQGGYDAVNCVASGITTPDTSTVVFNFSSPYAPFIDQLNVTEAAMNPSHLYPASGCPSQGTMDANAVGTGPFMLSGGGAGLNVPAAGDATVVRNPQYWKTGAGGNLPYLNKIVMVPYTDETARYNAVTSGAAGWMWDTALSKVATLQATPGYATSATQSLGGGPNSVDEFIFNLWAVGSSVSAIQGGTATAHPILSDVTVRKAIAESIDRNAYLTGGRFNVGTVSQSPISSQIFGHESDIPLPSLNTADANNLLDAAGWAGTRVSVNGTSNVRTKTSDNATPLTLNFLQGSATLNNQVGVIKGNLAAVGIDLHVTLSATATADWFTNRLYDAYLLNYAQGYDPQIGVPRQYLTNQISTVGTPNNAPGYRNPAVDADINSAATTLDPVARYNFYHDFQQRVVTDLPYVWLVETPNVRGFSTRCSGLLAYTGLFAESASCSG